MAAPARTTTDDRRLALTPRPLPRLRRHRRRGRSSLAVLVLALTVSGLVGAYRYIWTFWLYRGFPPPSLPAAQGSGSQRQAVHPGTLETIDVYSPAVGLTLPAVVYLPPGYFAHPHKRYPSMYLLHGVPGSPQQFVEVGDVQVIEALLVARHQMPPTILVMPEGAPSLLDDTEWVDSVDHDQKWMTYVATDVVNAVDHRFRVLARRRDRAIAGLSEGGYGAFNTGLHHLSEFGIIESWSGYTQASTNKRYFGGSAALVAANSPSHEALVERETLLADRTVLWFYCGRSDSDLGQNVRFARELTRLGVPYTFFVRAGGHNWKLWRGLISQSMIAAGNRFAAGHARPTTKASTKARATARSPAGRVPSVEALGAAS